MDFIFSVSTKDLASYSICLNSQWMKNDTNSSDFAEKFQPQPNQGKRGGLRKRNPFKEFYS